MESLVSAFITKYPNHRRILEAFERANGELPTWDNITKAHLYAFVTQLKTEVANNTAKTYCKMFKSVVNLYSDQLSLSRDWGKVLSIKEIATISVYLNAHDITKLIAYTPIDREEAVVRNQFVVGCLTGARHSDYIHFNEYNIMDNKVVYVSQKTKIKSEIPCAPAVRRILTTEDISLDMHRIVFNRIVRQICRNCDITEHAQVFRAGEQSYGPKWRYVSSHTARRSFATNLYLKSKDLYLVSKMMGHKTAEQTMKYIVDFGEPNEGVLRFFEYFK